MGFRIIKHHIGRWLAAIHPSLNFLRNNHHFKNVLACSCCVALILKRACLMVASVGPSVNTLKAIFTDFAHVSGTR